MVVALVFGSVLFFLKFELNVWERKRKLYWLVSVIELLNKEKTKKTGIIVEH